MPLVVMLVSICTLLFGVIMFVFNRHEKELAKKYKNYILFGSLGLLLGVISWVVFGYTEACFGCHEGVVVETVPNNVQVTN